MLEQSHGTPLPNVIQLGVLDVAKYAWLNPVQAIQWVKNLHFVASSIVNGNASFSDYSVFWIGLYESIESLIQYLEGFNKFSLYTNLYAKALSLRNLFTPEELILIEYERNCHAHIFQNGYRINGVYNKGKLTKDGLYRKGKQKIEIQKVIEAELKKYNINENQIAKVYSQKILRTLDELHALMKKEFNK